MFAQLSVAKTAGAAAANGGREGAHCAPPRRSAARNEKEIEILFAWMSSAMRKKSCLHMFATRGYVFACACRHRCERVTQVARRSVDRGSRTPSVEGGSRDMERAGNLVE